MLGTEGPKAKFSRRAVAAGIGLAATRLIFPDGASAGARLYRQPREKQYPFFDEATASVIPPSGYQARIALKDSIAKLVRHRVISRDKYRELQRLNGQSQSEFAQLPVVPSNTPIRLTRDNAGNYVNLLWPVGLSNRLDANTGSPLNGPNLDGFASTGGWTLGMEATGGGYFNKFPIVEMSPAAETLAVRVATSTYRPCCNNSTFFQDCNHGSALFAVLQLGASQGLAEAELYREALAFNSFWFPDYYIATALYFKVARKMDWKNVDAKLIMGPEFSAGGPWQQNVMVPLQAYKDLVPGPGAGANCGT